MLIGNSIEDPLLIELVGQQGIYRNCRKGQVGEFILHTGDLFVCNFMPTYLLISVRVILTLIETRLTNFNLYEK